MEKNFTPNVQWMAEKYDEINKRLFGGELGSCDFGIFTTGRGSEGGVLGWFKLCGWNIRIDRYSRRMFYNGSYDRIYINKDNFVEYCKPKIELNGNYLGTENGFLATLVHEMCHYYTYMYGSAPKQGHGPEFRYIGSIVSSRSKGEFTIQRIASAEQMSELELNAVMKAKRAKRLANKKASVYAVIVLTSNNEVRLTLTSKQSLINLITTSCEERGDKVITTNDADVIEYLFNKNYKKSMRTWRYWSLENKPWIDEFKSMILGLNRDASNNNVQQLQEPTKPKGIFSINTSKGKFETEFESFQDLRVKLQQRFPNMSYEVISKLMGNKNNFKKMLESKINVKAIVEGVLNEFMKNEFKGANNNDSVEITPNMNLGIHSPLEME